VVPWRCASGASEVPVVPQRWLNPLDSCLDMGTVTGCLPKCATASRKSSSSIEAMSRLTPMRIRTRWTGMSAAVPGRVEAGHRQAPVPQPVGQVEQGVAGILALSYPPGDRRDAGGRVAVAEQLERAQLDDLRREVLPDVVGGLMDLPVALEAQAQEVVVAGDDLPGRPGKVDLEDRHVAAQVVDVEDQVVRQFGGVAPDDPAHPEGSQPALVPRGGD